MLLTVHVAFAIVAMEYAEDCLSHLLSRFQVDEIKLQQVCVAYHIRKLSVFGSALHEQLKDESDLDLLVEFHPECVPGLIGLAKIQDELTVLFGRAVDLRTVSDLSPYFRADVLAEARVEYASA